MPATEQPWQAAPMPGSPPVGGAQRQALGNAALVRFTAAHSLAVMAEWGIFVAALVAVFERDGAVAAGFGSIVMQLAYIVFSPVSGALASRHPPHLVRTFGLLAQTVAYAACATASAAGLGSVAVVGAATIAIGAVTSLRPSGAALLPAIVRSSRELTVANLWVGYADGVALVGGPLAMAVLLVLGGPTAAIAGCAVLSAAAAAASASRATTAPPPHVQVEARGTVALLTQNLRHVTARPGVAGVLVLASAQNMLLGALDMLVVVIADEHVDLGGGGAGVLATLFGVGALVGSVAATAFVRRARVAPAIAVGVGVLGAASILFGVLLTTVVAVSAMVLLGTSQSIVDRLSSLLLHRSAPPESLAAVFATIELGAGIGLFGGAILAQLLVALSGAEAALIGVGLSYLVLLTMTLRPVVVADASADVPTVAMSLLRRTPVFRLLPRQELEDLGRACVEIELAPGREVIRQGDVGTRFYVVADGTFDAFIDGHAAGEVVRGGCFGEIALLTDAPRMASVTARTSGRLLAVDRGPFLTAVTGHDSTERAAWDVAETHRRGRDDASGSDR